MKINMLEPAKGNADCQLELEEAALRVLRSGQFILGEEVVKFEKQCEEYLGVKHAIGVSSGTDALLMALMAHNIERGDEVICPSFTFFATAGSISRTGAQPVFVDVYKDCFTIDTELLEKAITPRTKAIIPVHLFGQSANMIEIMRIAEKHNLIVIEDAAQAIGSKFEDKMVGTIGDVGCFSFFPSKNLGGFGDAGLVTTQSDELALKLKSIRNHGMTEQYRHETIGGNFRIDALQAALLSVKLSHLNTQEALRIEHANHYGDILIKSNVASFDDKDNVLYTLPADLKRGLHVYNQYTIKVSNGHRDALKAFLHENGIGSAVYYPIPLHEQECFKPLQDTELFPVSNSLKAECLSIPIASEVTLANIMEIEYKLIEFADTVSKTGE